MRQVDKKVFWAMSLVHKPSHNSSSTCRLSGAKKTHSDALTQPLPRLPRGCSNNILISCNSRCKSCTLIPPSSLSSSCHSKMLSMMATNSGRSNCCASRHQPRLGSRQCNLGFGPWPLTRPRANAAVIPSDEWFGVIPTYS